MAQDRRLRRLPNAKAGAELQAESGDQDGAEGAWWECPRCRTKEAGPQEQSAQASSGAKDMVWG